MERYVSLSSRWNRCCDVRVAGRLKLVVRATSLGGIHSLIEHRASVEGPKSKAPGGLLRMSVGLEHPQDIIDDSRQPRPKHQADYGNGDASRPPGCPRSVRRRCHWVGFLGRHGSGLALYRRRLLMHLSNPKSILAWIALVTLGLGPDASTTVVILMLAGCAVLSVTIFSGMPSCFPRNPWSGYIDERGRFGGRCRLCEPEAAAFSKLKTFVNMDDGTFQLLKVSRSL